jgi:hypothetical protein
MDLQQTENATNYFTNKNLFMYEGILAISFIIVYDITVQPLIFKFFLSELLLAVMIIKYIKPYKDSTKIKPKFLNATQHTLCC